MSLRVTTAGICQHSGNQICLHPEASASPTEESSMEPTPPLQTPVVCWYLAWHLERNRTKNREWEPVRAVPGGAARPEPSSGGVQAQCRYGAPLCPFLAMPPFVSWISLTVAAHYPLLFVVFSSSVCKITAKNQENFLTKPWAKIF